MKISCDSIQCGLRQRLLSQNQVNRRVGFTEEKPTVTPLTRQFHALSLTDHEGRNDGEHARRAERDVCAVRQVGFGRL